MNILGGILWLSGAAIFTGLFSKKFYVRAVILIFIIALPSDYGGLKIFNYAEPFPSPRLFAEGLVLIAVAWGQRRLWWRCGLALILAGLLHPFMALPGVGVCFLFAAQRHARLWLLVPIGALAFAGLAAIGIDPFAHIRSIVGGVWWTVVAERTAYAFITKWSVSDFARLATQGFIFALAYRVARPDERRLMWAATLVAALGILATLVGGDWLHDELFVEVPFYRTLWLWTVLVNALAGLLLWRTRDERPHIRAALAVGVGIYALDAWVPFEMPFIAMPVLATLLINTRRRPSGQELASTDKLALFSVSLVATLLAVTFLVYRLGGDAIRSTAFDYPLLDFFYLLAALSAAGLAFRGFRTIAMGVLAATIVAQVATYDQRSGPHFEDSPPKLPQTVAALVDRSANVYWEDGVGEQWLGLRRPAYFSCIQGAGVAFHKRTALEYYRRETGLRRLNTDDFADSRVMSPCPVKASNSALGPTSRAQLASACRALPDLDLIVLYARIPGAYSAEWPLPRTVYLGNPRRMFDHQYLYECRTLR